MLGAFAAVVLLAAAGLIAWRVLRPAEVSYPASAPYPAAATAPRPGVVGRFFGAALIVDGRLRVHARDRTVRADGPVDAATQRTPVWSYRRWPERVAGVVAVGATVVTGWTDGLLVAIDARTGTVAWRVRTGSGSLAGDRRTGSDVLWASAGLHTAGDAVLVRGDNEVRAHDAATGDVLWTAGLARECGDGFTTAGGLFVCRGSGTAVAVPTGARTAFPPGPAAPVGCAAAASACAGVRGADGRGWLTGAATPRRAPALDPPASTAVGDIVVAPAGPEVVASTLAGTAWRFGSGAGARVLAVQPGLVHLLTEDRRLVTLDAATGAVRSAFPYTFGKEKPTWTPGAVYAAGGFVAVERLAAHPDPAAGEEAYWFTSQTVLLAGT